MSRVGKIPIEVPNGVTVDIRGTHVRVKGPKGELERELTDQVKVVEEGGRIEVKRRGDQRADRAAQGLTRRLVANMVDGVTEGFSKRLEINGVGYRADAKGDLLHLSLGFSHPVIYQLPEGVSAQVENQTLVTISGADCELVGQVAAEIRKLRPPEPYKGKGVRYVDEYVRRKAGKTGATAA